MSVEVEKEMLNAIFAARDEEYADFTAKLIPNVPRESIIGVRTPQLRALARELDLPVIVHDREAHGGN